MSSCPSSILPSSPPPAPRGVGFIDLDTAAKRSGKNKGHLARLCRSTWAAQNLARLEPPAKGGKPTWWIREDADEALARVKFPEQIFADLSKETEQKRQQAIARKKTLDDCEAHIAHAGKALGVDRALAARSFAESRGVSLRTLQLWQKAYRQQGLAGLVDRRGKGAAPWADHPFIEEVKRLYLLPRQLSKMLCYEMTLERAAEQGWPTAHYKTCLRAIKQIPQGVVDKLRYGETAFTNRSETFIERDYSQLQSNQLWNADHHKFDVTCLAPDGKGGSGGFCRPWLTAIQDLRSRFIVGWSIFAHDPNTDTIIDALVMGIGQCGKPAEILVDNGKDFDSHALHGRTKRQRRQGRLALDAERAGGFFTALDIKVHHAQPYHGQSKPVERFFGTLEDRFGRTWPTYFGNKPENRPADYQKNLDAGQAPTVQELADAFAEWLANDYHQRPHAGDSMDGKSPAQVFAENLHTKVIVRANVLAEFALPLTPAQDVVQNGVEWKGLFYGKREPGLIPYQGKKKIVRLRAARDLSCVRIYTLAGVFICEALPNQKLPPNADAQMLRDAMAEKRRDTKLRTQFYEAAPRMTDDLPARLARAAVSRNKANQANNPQPLPPNPNIRPHRTPLEAQLTAVQNARQPLALRLAAGGERDVQAPPPRRSLLDAAEDLDLPARPQRSSGILSLAQRLGDA